MCKKVTCDTCGRPTWQGCGQHIEEALADVRPEDRCTCPRDDAPRAAQGGTSLGSW